jgi:hypothetical protein
MAAKKGAFPSEGRMDEPNEIYQKRIRALFGSRCSWIPMAGPVASSPLNTARCRIAHPAPATEELNLFERLRRRISINAGHYTPFAEIPS